MKKIVSHFIHADEGSNVVEYALVISLVSIVLAIGLSSVIGGGLQANIATLVARLGLCFTANATTC